MSIPAQGAVGAETMTAGQSLDLRDLRAANIARQAEWCPDQVPDLSFRGNELGGECGEAQNVIKKLERERQGWRGSRATKDDLADELADVVICADLCAVTADIDLGAAVRRKFNVTSEKQGLSVFLPLPALASPRTDSAERTAFRPGDLVRNARYKDPDAYPALGESAYVQAIDGDYLDFGQGSKLLYSLFDLATPRADSDERTAGSIDRSIVAALNGINVVEAAEEYEFCPDEGSHTPTEFEKALLIDFAYGLMNTVHEVVRPLVSAAPAQPAGAVPDTLREAFASATDSPLFVHDFADPRVSSAPSCQDVNLSFTTPDHITAAFMGNGEVGTIEQARKDATALAAAWNHVRTLLASHPAGQSAGSGADVAAYLRDLDRVVAVPPGDPRLEARVGPAGPAAGMDGYGSQARPLVEPAPDSTRTGDEGTVGLAEQEAVTKAAERAVQQLENAASGGLFHCEADREEAVEIITEALWGSPLAARPAAPEAQGAWSFDMEAAPRDGSDVEVVNDRGQFIAQFDRSWGRSYADAGWWMVSDGKDTERPLRGDEPFAWRIPTKAPAPPASSGQGGR